MYVYMYTLYVQNHVRGYRLYNTLSYFYTMTLLDMIYGTPRAANYYLYKGDNQSLPNS